MRRRELRAKPVDGKVKEEPESSSNPPVLCDSSDKDGPPQTSSSDKDAEEEEEERQAKEAKLELLLRLTKEFEFSFEKTKKGKDQQSDKKSAKKDAKDAKRDEKKTQSDAKRVVKAEKRDERDAKREELEFASPPANMRKGMSFESLGDDEAEFVPTSWTPSPSSKQLTLGASLKRIGAEAQTIKV